MFAYCGNDPVNRSDVGGLFWKEIGDWFKSVGTAVVNFANATFGASSSVVRQDKKETIIRPNLYIISAKSGTKTTTTISEQGDSSKPISVYAVGVSNNIAASSIGIKINAPTYTWNISLGPDNTGISKTIKAGTMSNSVGLRASLMGLKLGIEGATTARLSDKSNQTDYFNVSANGMILAAAVIFVRTGQWNGLSQQPAY